MDFGINKENILHIKCDVLALGRFEKEKFTEAVRKVDKALGGALSRISEEEKFGGELGRSIMVNTLGKIGAERVLLLGLGKKSKFSPDVSRRAGVLAVRKSKSFSRNIVYDLPGIGKKGDLAGLIEGTMLGGYEFDKYKTNKKAQGIKKVEFILNGIKQEEFRKELEFAKIISEATNFARDLVNEPPMVLTPTKLAIIAREVAEEGGLECEIFDREEIEERGMGALLAVSRGSEEPPKFIRLTYRPKKRARKTVAVVGKGITFDSGGLCIKPRESMKTMKMDMSGAACVLGVMKAISKLNPSVKVHGVISSTENMPGAMAYKPDDIIRNMSGKTIEVIDTDAEGRIVLSDALSYAVQLKADEIVDVATLTGACIVALGTYTAGLMGNDEKLINKIQKAAELAGEKVWQLPMDDELRKDIESDVADVKNVGGRYGGAIYGAMFLEKFVNNTPWVHLDIAGPAFLEKGSDFHPKGGTGFGVRTLIQYLLR
ncbi:MAG TPA: leucyl aminopeptidase [Thermodesulfobacteriota bacterium]|nr:leucyl aminopeptidase [Thermodesulfobacteriota bacterium]